jgi:arginyl-tRNA--protein-N-Asp/Glu arginylyltransferase
MKNQEITPGDTIVYNLVNNVKVVQPINKQAFVNEKGRQRTHQDMINLFSDTAFDKRAESFTLNSESVVNEVQTFEPEFTAKERYNAKKDYKDFKKENPNGFNNSLKQFRAMVTDKFANTKMRVRMNVTVIGV